MKGWISNAILRRAQTDTHYHKSNDSYLVTFVRYTDAILLVICCLEEEIQIAKNRIVFEERLQHQDKPSSNSII